MAFMATALHGRYLGSVYIIGMNENGLATYQYEIEHCHYILGDVW